MKCLKQGYKILWKGHSNKFGHCRKTTCLMLWLTVMWLYMKTVVMTAQLGNLAKFTESYTENVYETLVHKIIPQ